MSKNDGGLAALYERRKTLRPLGSQSEAERYSIENRIATSVAASLPELIVQQQLMIDILRPDDESSLLADLALNILEGMEQLAAKST